ncbi:MAG: ABC transporter ATP-binding protein [Halofilum sp. (in: g-proteobacteria)]|nr:ABC transporter ATP-binding protein [Halofilum sp. (in: g-proteobacteria)]
MRASDGVDLDVLPGELHAVIGPNGAGKTTLIGELAGEIRPDAGTIGFAGRDITRLSVDARARAGLARSFQVTSVFPGLSVRDNAALAAQAHAGHSFRFWRPVRRETALNERGHGGARARRPGRRAPTASRATSSHGEQRQLELAMVLAGEPRLLLLDEPMAGLGQEEVARLSALLDALRAEVTIVLVEHDMDVVFSLSDRITVLIFGRNIVTGPPAAIRASEAVRAAYLGDAA